MKTIRAPSEDTWRISNLGVGHSQAFFLTHTDSKVVHLFRGWSVRTHYGVRFPCLVHEGSEAASTFSYWAVTPQWGPFRILVLLVDEDTLLERMLVELQGTVWVLEMVERFR